MSFLSTATAQGPRDHQEDRYCAINSSITGTVLAVMDGHGLETTSEFCVQAFPEMLTKAVTRMNKENEAADVLRKVILDIAHATAQHSSGTTLSVVWIPPNSDVCFAAVIGDSPVVISTNTNVLLGPEHNVRTNLRERQAAISRGGEYTCGYMMAKGGNGLQLSRALGDVDLGDIIQREPEVFLVSDPQWILVGSDGLFAPSHDQEGAEILSSLSEVVNQKREGTSANDFLDWTQKRRGFYDNVSAVFWHR